ncbi:MAG: amidohydrolase family protein [Cellulosilyticaceae bacterium]
MFDLIIKNGMVIDGTGMPKVKRDIAILDGKIVKIEEGLTDKSKRVIDATDKLVTPGFIDIHRHADAAIFEDSFGELELRQGLTTIINGNCGLSIVPAPKKYRKQLFEFLQPVIGCVNEDYDFHTFKDYIELVKQRPLPLNVGMNIGNGTVRAATKGYEPSKFTTEEMTVAQRYLRESLENGAMGVSLGLVYAPENCYDFEELVEVLQPMKEFEAPLVTHIRGEGDLFHESLREVIALARKLGVKLHISHLKCIGERNWGHGMKEALHILYEAREAGMHVTYDVYPYTAGSTQLIQVLPPEYLEGGTSCIIARLKDPESRKRLTAILEKPQDYFENLVSSIGWHNICISALDSDKNKAYLGKSIAEIAAIQGKDAYACAYDLLAEENCNISMVDYIVSEEDIISVLKDPYSSIISDSTYAISGMPHPRVYATCPRILMRYVREMGVLTIEEAIYKITAMPASVYGIKEKGRLATGMDADIAIFELENIQSKANYDAPKQFATGFDYVLVNGEVAIENDRLTHNACGKVLIK